jgi:acyl carrier protein
MTGRASVQETVLAALRDVIPGAPELDPDTELLSSGLLDSLGIVTVVSGLEHAYGVEFPAELLLPETFADPAALSAAVSGVLTAAAAAASGAGSAPSEEGALTA